MKRKPALKKKGIAAKLMFALFAVCGRFYSNGKFSAAPEPGISVPAAADDQRQMDEAHEAISEHTEEKIAVREKEFLAIVAVEESLKDRAAKAAVEFDAENPNFRARNQFRAWKYRRERIAARNPGHLPTWDKYNPQPQDPDKTA